MSKNICRLLAAFVETAVVAMASSNPAGSAAPARGRHHVPGSQK